MSATRFTFRIFSLLLLSSLYVSSVSSQELPHEHSNQEKLLMPSYYKSLPTDGKYISVPPSSSVRNAAEWEEIHALLISWQAYTSILVDIVDAAQEECLVLISCDDSNSVKSTLSSSGVPITNIRFIETPTNSVWCRDYSANNVYKNDVDSIYLCDWVYNRPRPADDANPVAIADFLGIPLYSMTTAPWRLVATGGNFMSDGFGNAFSSDLIVDENAPGGGYSQNLSEADIDTILKHFLGIDRYVSFNVLPYDGIHHIDMHMKLLDEETFLIGEFPAGVSDGPQIEANLLYLTSNFNSVFGTPYKIVRVPMPPSSGGNYPPIASYRTYANGVFVNKTYIVPTFYEEYDTTALRILHQYLPGYNIVPINCQSMISAGGAIHCITNCINDYEPLLISHQRLEDTYNSITPNQVDALIKTISGVQWARVYYTTDTTQAWNYADMTLTDPQNATWTGYIPAQSVGTTVHYYVQAHAISGKEQVRPITAPEGFWKFNILPPAGMYNEATTTYMMNVFPNPASSITCIPLLSDVPSTANIGLYDILGRKVLDIFDGAVPRNRSNYFFDAALLEPGTYFVWLETPQGISTQKVVVK